MRRYKLVWLCVALALVLVATSGCTTSKPAQTEAPKKQEAPAKDPKIARAYEYSKPGDSREMPEPPKPDKQYTIGVALPHLANPHFVAQAYGYFDEAAKYGAKVVLFEAGGYANLERQVKQVEDLIAMPVDAIILVAVNLEGTVPVVDSAAKAGIPVINVNVMTKNEKVVTRIRSDDEQIGRMHAEYMAKKLNGKGNVLMLDGPAGTTWAMYRAKGFKDYMQQNCPNIKIIAERFLDSDPAAGMKEMEDALQAYKQIDGVFTGSDFLGVGAAQAIAAAGKAGKIVVTTTDSQDDCIKAIRDGRITATVVQSSTIMGRWGVRAAIWTLQGKADQLLKQYWTPLTIVDKSNVDTFNFEGVSRPPAGWKIPTS
ncbi:MAG: sugar ABC transporter substrate-binding protein [Bacillota bacterium]